MCAIIKDDKPSDGDYLTGQSFLLARQACTKRDSGQRAGHNMTPSWNVAAL